jgi:hypothetical protein
VLQCCFLECYYLDGRRSKLPLQWLPPKRVNEYLEVGFEIGKVCGMCART